MKAKNYLLAIDLDVGDVVLEDGGDVHFGELVLAEDDEEASLSARAVADDDQLLADRRHLCFRQTRVFFLLLHKMCLSTFSVRTISRETGKQKWIRN